MKMHLFTGENPVNNYMKSLWRPQPRCTGLHPLFLMDIGVQGALNPALAGLPA